MSTTTRDIHAVLTGVAELARTAYEHWDADRDTKVGKILLSLAGYLPGYDCRADAVQAALAAQKPTENIREGYPYDDPAFEALCREHDIWGTALAALCAVFWREAHKPVEGDAKEPIVTLSGHQLLEALDFIAPDRDTDPQQLEGDVSIQYGDGHAGRGHYCWVTDEAHEGAILLGDAAIAQQGKEGAS